MALALEVLRCLCGWAEEERWPHSPSRCCSPRFSHGLLKFYQRGALAIFEVSSLLYGFAGLAHSRAPGFACSCRPGNAGGSVGSVPAGQWASEPKAWLACSEQLRVWNTVSARR